MPLSLIGQFKIKDDCILEPTRKEKPRIFHSIAALYTSV